MEEEERGGANLLIVVAKKMRVEVQSIGNWTVRIRNSSLLRSRVQYNYNAFALLCFALFCFVPYDLEDSDLSCLGGSLAL